MKNIRRFNENQNWAENNRLAVDDNLHNIYLVEMTNNSEWETIGGFHLVRASSVEEVRQIIQRNMANLDPDQDIVAISPLNEFIGDDILTTIHTSREE